MVVKIARLPTRSARYLETGNGTPLVLIHGFPLNAEQWLPQLNRPEPGCRLIAPDLTGFGPSEAGGPRLSTMDGYAEEVLDLMNHLDIRRAAVCGLSMGGYVAFAILRKAADRVSGLVLANTRSTADSAEARAGRDRMLQLLRTEGPRALAANMIPKLLGETTRREQPDLMDAVERLIDSNHSEGLASAIVALKERPDSTPQLQTIACPATIIYGDEDAIIPRADAEAMHQAIRGARLVVLQKAGHLSNLENPFAFNAALFSSITNNQ